MDVCAATLALLLELGRRERRGRPVEGAVNSGGAEADGERSAEV
jgi:hypothetical protein